MQGCHIGRNFQVSVAGGSYQDGLTAMVHGAPAGMLLTDIPVIYTGLNAADTIEGAGNDHHTNGTPISILIPNLDRHFIHIKQYQDTNRTPRPGHASYASFAKYGPDDDAIGAGIFSGRYTSTIVGAGYVAKKILKAFGIEVFSFIKEAAGVECPDMDSKTIFEYTERYKKMRHDYDPFYQEIFVNGRLTPDMRFLQKIAVLAEVENEIDEIRGKAPKIIAKDVIDKYGVHPVIDCPDIKVADEMLAACNEITKTGDSSGGIVEVRVTGVPVGLGEPVFYKLDAELGRMLGIGAVKGVEVGAGFGVKDMTGHQSNDQLHTENGQVVFDSNHAGGITGGLSSGQDIVVKLAVKPTPTIDKPQHTIDKYTLENTDLAAITRRDPTIVGRIWPVAENYTAMVILDHLLAYLGYEQMKEKFTK
ncbi:MAG: chorismate synthase [Planctomycetota bacterium]|jgi:chorismate synthase